VPTKTYTEQEGQCRQTYTDSAGHGNHSYRSACVGLSALTLSVALSVVLFVGDLIHSYSAGEYPLHVTGKLPLLIGNLLHCPQPFEVNIITHQIVKLAQDSCCMRP
jgi:hypothetical protein